jgi:acyl transferase domain-containing protein
MLRDLFVAFPWLHEVLEHGKAWIDILYPPTAYSEHQLELQHQAITDTRVAQPLLGVVEMAAVRLLLQCGLVPTMLAGHSYGELVALAVAGCFDLSTLMTLSRERGAAIIAAAGSEAGKMAAVNCGYRQLAEALQTHPQVVLANQNSPAQTVISGPANAVDAALKDLKRQSIAAQPLAVACAFHSPVVAAAVRASTERYQCGIARHRRLLQYHCTALSARGPDDQSLSGRAHCAAGAIRGAGRADVRRWCAHFRRGRPWTHAQWTHQ